MPYWTICVWSLLYLQVASTQYFFWTPCHLQYGGECRGLCHDGEVNLGLPYCSTPDSDIVSYQGTCCVALPCWYLGGICRRECIPLYETKYDLPTTCPDIRSTCCMSSRELLSHHPLPRTTTTHTTTTTLATTKSHAFTTTTLPDWIGDCGLPQSSGSGYSVSSPGPCVFPWVVSLRTTFSPHYCSGVLVSDNTVLTVAACVEGIEASQLVLTLGDYDVEAVEATEVVVNVTSITRHPLHGRNRRGFDLALLKMGSTVSSTCVSRVCLPGTNTSPVNLGYGRCMLAGWGQDAGVTSALNARPVRVYDTLACSRLLEALWSNTTLPGDVICSLQDDNDAGGDCQVDGGSMLICPDVKDRYFLFGIVTEFTCNNPAMALYTDISFHSEWITRHSQRGR